MTKKEYRAWLAEYDFIGVAQRKRHQREAAQVAQKTKTITTMETQEAKKCKVCGRVLPLTEFNACALTKDGLQTLCKECMRKKKQEGYKKYKKYKQKLAEEVDQAIAEATYQTDIAEAASCAEEVAPQAEVETCNIGDIPEWVLFAELRRRGYKGVLTKECIV